MALPMPRKPPTEEEIWRRGGDGSTFRGASRGRGRSGARPGGRTGGGGIGYEVNGSTTSTLAESLRKADLPAKPSLESRLSTADYTADGAASAKGRPSRRGSRNTPSHTTNSATPTDSSSRGPASASVNSNSRRRPTARSNSKNSARTQTPSPTVSTRSSVLSSSRGGSIASMEPPARPKDLPPHLTQPAAAEPAVPEIRNDVETLVEHMRSVAMQRPVSPGHNNHIDWAGDEDDELPDLDDWGYGPKDVDHAANNLAPPMSRDDVISPILEGSLKSLPIIDIGTPTNDTPRAAASAVAEDAAALLQVKVKEVASAGEKASESSSTEATVANGSASGSQPVSPEKAKSRRGARLRGKDKGLKTDAAAKATVAASSNAAVKEEQTPAKAPSPAEPTLMNAGVKPADKLPTSIVESNANLAAPVEPTKESASPTGLAASMHAPSGLAASIHAPAGLSASIHAPPGLAASIHAPKPSEAVPQSAPSHTITHPIPTAGPDRAPPTHTRSQSRPPPIRPNKDSQSPSRLTNARIHGDGHSRTQSTPVTPMTRGGGAHARPPQTVRPVLTVGALSQLARTLGGRQMGGAGRRTEVATGDK